MIRVNDQRFWLYAAVDPGTNEFLHICLFTAYATALTDVFPQELPEKHDVDDAVFLVNDADWLKTALQWHGLDFRYERHEDRNSIECVFRKVKRRTFSFSNCFNRVEPETAETWLQTFVVWHNTAN